MQEHDEVTKMDQVERLMQRPLLYNNIDGVGELGIGFMLLGFALLTWLQARSPAGAIWHRMDVFLVWVGLMLLGIHYGSKAIKQHITFPRTGFVEYRKQKARWALAFTLGGVNALVAAGLAFAARSHWSIGSHWGMTTPIALIGLEVAALYAWKIAGEVRWKWAVAAAMAICTIVIAMLPAGVVAAVAGSTSAVATLDERSSGAWLLSIMLYGVILLISGGISFVHYLRHTQPAAETAE
jgi:hypothetical protein